MFSCLNKDIPFFFSSYYQQKKWIKGIDYIFALQLSSNFSKNKNIIKKSYKTTPYNYKINLLNAKINVLENKKDYTLHKPPFYAHLSFKADYYYLSAQKELYLTDLQNASNNISKALKIYKKLGYLYECALCYQTFATIYKLCGLKDISYTMLTEAKKLYEHIKCPAKLAETNAYLGIHELTSQNYQNAIDYFDLSQKICTEHNLKKTMLDILNWKAFALFQQGDYKNALKTAKLVQNATSVSSNTKSFCYEIISRIYYQQSKPLLAIKHANLGLDIAQKQKDMQYNFELNFLKAEAFFMLKKYTNAKDILITLIKQKYSNCITFYPANAYSLLGLIYLKENNLKQAQNMFKSALDLEHSKNRSKGAIIDYNNLAEISLKLGNKKTAQKYLQHAIDLAKELKDNNLESYLQKKLKN